jgi:hypothetical protein
MTPKATTTKTTTTKTTTTKATTRQATVARPPARVTTGSARDRAVTGLILGVAGTAWFGWAHEGPPAGWSVPLDVGSFAGPAVAVACGVLVWRRRDEPSAMDDPGTRRRYLLIVAIEVLAILVGVAALNLTGHPAYLSAWVLFVVGVHFAPLARLFATPGLTVTGVALAVVAVVAAIAGGSTTIRPSAVAGAAAGVIMLIGAVGYLSAAARRAS